MLMKFSFFFPKIGLPRSLGESGGAKPDVMPLTTTGSHTGSIAGGEQFLLAGIDEDSDPTESLSARGHCIKNDKNEVATPPPNNNLVATPNTNLVTTPNNAIVATPDSPVAVKTDRDVESLLHIQTLVTDTTQFDAIVAVDAGLFIDKPDQDEEQDLSTP